MVTRENKKPVIKGTPGDPLYELIGDLMRKVKENLALPSVSVSS